MSLECGVVVVVVAVTTIVVAFADVAVVGFSRPETEKLAQSFKRTYFDYR